MSDKKDKAQDAERLKYSGWPAPETAPEPVKRKPRKVETEPDVNGN